MTQVIDFMKARERRTLPPREAFEEQGRLGRPVEPADPAYYKEKPNRSAEIDPPCDVEF